MNSFLIKIEFLAKDNTPFGVFVPFPIYVLTKEYHLGAALEKVESNINSFVDLSLYDYMLSSSTLE